MLTFGGLSMKEKSPYLETSIEGCTNETFSDFITKPEKNFWMPNEVTDEKFSTISQIPFPQNIFLVSYMYYVLFGTLITVGLGIFISLITRSKDDAFDSKLIHPGVYKLTTYLPCCDKLFTKAKTSADDLPGGNYVMNEKCGVKNENENCATL
jgi:hypothetical protein